MREAIRQLIETHHAAFAVELLGASASGVSADQIESMLAAGLVDPAKLGGFVIPGMANACDAISAAHVQGALPLGASLTIPAPAPTTGLSGVEVASASAAERAGIYARGLGNAAGAEIDAALSEVWEGTTIIEEVQPQVRAETIELIRDRVAGGPGQDPRAVARDLARTTERWSHDWQRIAETEIQGAYNDGTLTDAVEAYGADALVARVPESGACKSCLSLFLDGEGKPIVWPVAELLANGVNVGRRRADWRATIWPMHPRCRCDTLTVPPGMYVTESGRLRKLRGMEDE